MLVFLPEPRSAGRLCHARPTRVRVPQPAVSGDLLRRSRLCAISKRRTHMLLYAFCIRCITHYASVAVRITHSFKRMCLYYCLIPAMQAGRTCSADQGASSPAVRPYAIPQRRTQKWLYASRIRLRVLVVLPDPRRARLSHHARPTRGRVPQPAARGALSRPSLGVCDSSTAHAYVAVRRTHPFTCACIIA